MKIIDALENGPSKDLFKVFHFVFEKQYDLNSEEGVARYRNFKKTLTRIKNVNSQNLGYTLGVNEFSDLTDEEFRGKFLTKVNIDYSNKELYREAKEPTEPITQGNINWTQLYRPAVHQMQCGSCWAFATAGDLEAHYMLKKKQMIQLSPQSLIDCDTTNNACQGGDSAGSMDWVAKNGIAMERDYPYVSGQTGQKGTCRKNVQFHRFVSHFEMCRGNCTRQVMLGLLQRGPLVVGIDGEGNGQFRDYKGGVIDLADCKQDNHAINLVGYGTEFSQQYRMNVAFYIIRNSWGGTWGERGFGKIMINDKRNNKVCFIEGEGILPILR